jgi:muramoyltetrapeptide carboxypeptidase LdcA involved in peptidoglycan recycling
VRSDGYDDWARVPTVASYALDAPGGWRLLAPADGDGLGDGDGDGDGDLSVTGRLVGGCLETVANLAGTPYGPLDAWAREHAPEGTLVYLEVAESGPFEAARRLHGLRLAGWFEHANAVLIGRTPAPDAPGYTQVDAVRDALGGLGVPVILDVDCGHVPPHLALVNGALGTVARTDGRWTLEQVLD